jgi:hypothetical protein
LNAAAAETPEPIVMQVFGYSLAVLQTALDLACGTVTPRRSGLALTLYTSQLPTVRPVKYTKNFALFKVPTLLLTVEDKHI